MYDLGCWLAAKDPKNIDKCLNNADSYTFFILAMYMLPKGWEYSDIFRARPYSWPESEEDVNVGQDDDSIPPWFFALEEE